MKTVIGADRVQQKLGALKKALHKRQSAANARSGEELARTARLLHPGDGINRAAILAIPQSDGSCLVDFGIRAKVTEGDRGPRPFVNPAKKATAQKRSRRMAAAVRAAVRETFGNG